jgi:hypothetical protein
VNCDEVRLLLGAEPGFSGTGVEEHLQSCAACRRFGEEMRTLDANIRRALGDAPPAVPQPRRAAPTWRVWALAASVALVTFAVLGAWLLRPTDTLARDVVAHVMAEPESWLTAQQVTAQDIGEALHGAGVELNITSDKVTYAQSCWFRGHYVPHLVLQTASGPATVLILRHEPAGSSRAFREEGMSGMIVPARDGSFAVLTRGGGDVNLIAQAVQQDVRWLPDAH